MEAIFPCNEKVFIKANNWVDLVKLDSFIVGDAVEILDSRFPAEFVDLTVTSPPYDNLRNYNGFTFDPHSMLSVVLKNIEAGIEFKTHLEKFS